jgi:hypothetical protein
LQPIGDDIGGLPTIDFGNRYIGDLIVPAYIGPVPSSGHRSDTCRLLDEIVCYAFHGYPPGGFRASRVLHLDGNQLECAADNLQWQVDAEYLVNEEEKAVRGWMRPDFLPHRVTIQPTTRARKELAWVEGQSVPGWTPVKEKKAV